MRRVAVMIYGRRPATAVDMVAGVAEFAALKGWQLIVRSVEDPYLIPSIARREVDGAIVTAQSEQQALELAELEVPMVNVVTSFLVGKVGTVLIDDERVGRLAAEHLAGLGLRNFAYVGYDTVDSTLRQNGFVTALREMGHACAIAGEPVGKNASKRRHWRWDELLGGVAIERWITHIKVPTGIMAFNDPIATAVIDACTRTGKRVPDDISVIGVDNDMLLCPYASIPLTSIDVGLRTLARRAAEMLESQFATGASDHAMVRLANLRVVTRRSTDTVAVADEQVREALEFIRAKACDRIGVEDVLNVVGLSRATLDRRFLAALGRTAGEEIRRVKAMTASRLLRDTDISLEEVARRSGFASQQHLCRAFKIAFNASPGAFRDDSTNGLTPDAQLD